jgi:hypothetical protein
MMLLAGCCGIGPGCRAAIQTRQVPIRGSSVTSQHSEAHPAPHALFFALGKIEHEGEMEKEPRFGK